MKYMTVKEYREQFYTEQSRPSQRLLTKLIKSGELSGRKMGKFYYIEIESKQNIQTN